jgi:hypothetical protein
MLKRIVFIALVPVVAPRLGSWMVVEGMALDRDPFMHEVE